MSTDARSWLTALRLADSMLPVGTHTASYGIEQYLNEDAIDTAEELRTLVAGYLKGMIGPGEIVALGHAHRAAANDDISGVMTADERLGAATVPAEFRHSLTKAGTKLLDLLRASESGQHEAEDVFTEYAVACENGEASGYYPVVLGIVCQQAGLGSQQAAMVSAYSSTTELLAAAQRLGRFGHTAIQIQLSNLFPVIVSISKEYHNADLDAMYSFTPLAEIRGMNHEYADRRLFMS